MPNELAVIGDTVNTPIPALIDRASQYLQSARSSAEVLEAKKIAELALHYAKVTRAANDAHADCLRIITRAEIRMANEIDRGQANGELANQGRPENVRTPDVFHETATLADLGVSKQRVSEWRDIRDAEAAEPGTIEGILQNALEEGRTPTKTEIVKHVRGTLGTGDNEWFTPPQYIEAARKVMGGIDLDPASNPIAQKTVQAERYFTKDQDGLKQEWNAQTVWLNPPYAQPFIQQFTEKMVAELKAKRVRQAIMLTHNYTDTAWFHLAESLATLICFTKGRIRFTDPEGKPCSPTQGQAFFYFGTRIEKFRQTFGQFGFVR